MERARNLWEIAPEFLEFRLKNQELRGNQGNSMLTAAENALSNHGLPKRREAWIKVLSWLTKKTYKVIMLTCIMLVWERYGECSAIPGVEERSSGSGGCCSWWRCFGTSCRGSS